MQQRLCTTHSNNYDLLEEIILDSIKNSCLNYIDKKKIKDQVINNINNLKPVDSHKELNNLSLEIRRINDNLDNIYLDKLNKKITEEQFARVKTKLELELNKKRKRYDELNNSIIDNLVKDKKEKNLNKYIDNFLTFKKPSRELIVNLVEKIEIFADRTINIHLVFKKINN
jgi:uncharacterized protein with von Willebrand factor type A (vWA) domain